MVVPEAVAHIEHVRKPWFPAFRTHRAFLDVHRPACALLAACRRALVAAGLAAIVLALAGCAGTGTGTRDGARAAAPLPGMAPIQAAESTPPPRRRKPARHGRPAGPVDVWVYVSAASQAQLMQMGADPTSATRLWENYFRAASTPFAAVSDAQSLNGVTTPGLLVLPSVTVLSGAERDAILDWRNCGGAVLSTWKTGAYSPEGEPLGFDFMRDVLDVEVVGDTEDEPDDVFMMVHGDDAVAHSLPAGTRVWLERVRNQLPLRLVGKHEAAQIMNWSRGYDVQKPAGLIAYNERRMPSGRVSRVVTIGYPEQNWQRSDPRQLKALTDDILAWLLRRPSATLGAWPYPYQSSILLALQAAEPVSENDLLLARTISAMGGRFTCYVHADNAAKAAPVIRKLQSLGHEIAYFGDVFEGFKDQPAEQQAERLDAMTRSIATAGIKLPASAGFAPPLDSYDATTLQLLQARGFDTSMTFMETTESTESYDATTERLLRKYGIRHHAADESAHEDRLPFFSTAEPGLPPEQALVVLPRTQMDDVTFTHLKLAPAQVSAILDFDLSLAVRSGSLSLLSVHSQNSVEGGLMLAVMGDYMRKVATYRDRLWVARGDEIARWWRLRDATHVEQRWNGDGIEVTLDNTASAPVDGLTVFVTLPFKGAAVRVAGTTHGIKTRVKPIDAYRAAVVVDRLPTGSSRLQIRF